MSSHQPLCHPVISSLRRGSLTGSLPDLSEATEEDVSLGRQLLEPDTLPCPPPLPAGSDVFSQVLQETEKEEKVGERKAIPMYNLKELREKAKNGTVTHKFRSRTAEAIHITRFGRCFPQYLEKLNQSDTRETSNPGEDPYHGMDTLLPSLGSTTRSTTTKDGLLWSGSHDNIHLPDAGHGTKHVSWGQVGVSTYVKGSVINTSLPNSPRLHRHQADGKLLTAKVSPLYNDSSVNSQSLCSSSERLPVMRTESSITSPRILKRKQKNRSVLARTASMD